MIPLLSNSNPFGGFSGEQLIVWLAIAFALMVMVEKGQTVLGRLRGSIPVGTDSAPAKVHMVPPAVTKAEHDALAEKVKTLEATVKVVQTEMMKEFALLRHEGESRATRIMSSIGTGNGAIHEKINGVNNAVTYMKGQMDAMKDLAQQSAKLALALADAKREETES